MRIEQRKVLVGKDWSLFKTIDFNREIDQKRVDELSKAILLTGYVAPILCFYMDGYYYIIDGQHRLYACKAIDKEIVVILIENVNDLPLLVSTLNKYNKEWRIEQFFNMWVILKKEGFLEIKEIISKYNLDFNKFNILSRNISSGSIGAGYSISEMRNPNYKLQEAKKKEIIKRATRFNDIMGIDKNFIELRTEKNFTIAVCKVISMLNYNHSRMLEICEKIIPLKGKKQSEYMNYIIDNYNRNIQEEKRLMVKVTALRTA